MWLYVPVCLLLDFLLLSVNVSTFVSVLHCLIYTSFLLGFIRTTWVIFQNKIFYCCGGNHKKFLSLWVQIEKERKLTPVILILTSRSVVADSLWAHGPQHPRPPCPSPSGRACSNSCPSSRWCHPAISSSVVPFSSHPQSFPASGKFSNIIISKT